MVVILSLQMDLAFRLAIMDLRERSFSCFVTQSVLNFQRQLFA
jgi:hypothetical protein